MSIFDEYNEFLDILWHTDVNGNKISIQRLNEQYKIVGNKIILNGIPDSFYKVSITGKYEIDIKQEITSAEYFKVDYLTGFVYFHDSLDGTTITIDEFYSRGIIKLFGKRINIQDSNNNWTSDNLEDLANEIKLYIDSNTFTSVNQTKLDGIEENANNYVHPTNHSLDIITETTTKKIMTDVERNKLTTIEDNANNYTHPSSHPATIITENETHRFFTDLERNKLSNIEDNANNYTHPTNHSPSIITQDENNRFVTDVEKNTWSNKVSQSELNNLKGIGYTNQTVKYNYDLIKILENRVDSIIDKPPVENYADLNTKYPNPEVGTYVFIKGTNDLNERGYYLFIDGETKILNGTNNSNWVLTEGSLANSNGLTIVSGVEQGKATLDVNLSNNKTYVMEYEIKTNNAPVNSLFINNTITDNKIVISKNLGKQTVEFTTKSEIITNTLEIVLNNLSGNEESVLIQVISVKEKDSFMWRRDTDLIPLADSNRNGLLSKSDYTKIQTNENNITSNLTKINKNITDIATNKQNHQDHLDSISAHNDNSINNTSVVAGGKVKDALNELNTKDNALDERINNIIAQSGTSDTEVVDSRNSAKYGAFTTLDARLEAIETRSKYFARENHTVLTGANTITLTNLPENNHELLIYDTKYGAIWDKNIHWTRSGATITFTSTMPEDLSFVVINLG